MFKTVLAAATAAALTLGPASAQVAAPSPAAANEARVVGIPRAIAIAEATAKGSVLEAEMDYEKGRLVYEVKTTAGRGIHEVLIDALSGDVVSHRPLRLDSVVQRLKEVDKLNAVRAGSGHLSPLLVRLEADRRSRVTDVSLERERGQTFYEVELANADRKVLIDPRTGRVSDGEYDD